MEDLVKFYEDADAPDTAPWTAYEHALFASEKIESVDIADIGYII